MKLVDVGQQLATQLGTILRGNATAYAPDRITPPGGYIFGPNTRFHETYGNGFVTVRLSATVAVSRQPADEAWRQLAEFMSNEGDKSVMLCLQAGTYTAFDTVVVTDARDGEVTIGDIVYKAAGFDLVITGS